MLTTPELKISPAAASHAAGLAELFASNGYGCHCRYWHFQGNNREWLERCAQRSEENCAEMQALLGAGSPEMWGMVALREQQVVGWLKLAPAASLGKLYGQRLYKDLPCFSGERAHVFSVSCLLVREDLRHQGIARALLRGAIAHAPGLGARCLEAFPRSDLGIPDVSFMTGPTRLFLEAGFEVVHDFQPYPVLRLQLGGATETARSGSTP
jgi:GNAT superfamily N-acetyltransferase